MFGLIKIFQHKSNIKTRYQDMASGENESI